MNNRSTPSGVRKGLAPFDDLSARAFLKLLVDPSKGCAEIRILEGSIDPRTRRVVGDDVYKGTIAVWGDEPDDLVDELVRVDGISAYVVLNPVNPALKARTKRFVKSKTTTTDDDIVCLRWLFVDFDAKRPAGISSTDEERRAAWERLQRVLNDHPEIEASAIWGCSGNGYWMLVRLPDYPNDAEHRELIARVLEWFVGRYSDNLVEIDPACKNPARIGPMVGTMKCKGISTPDRPHRPVTMESPADKIPPPLDLKAWAAMHAPAPTPGAAATNGAHAGGLTARATPSSAGDIEKRVIAYLATIEAAVSGQKGSDKTFGAVCRVGPGFDLTEDEAYRLIDAHYNPRCVPPWSEKEMRHKIADAYKKVTTRGKLLKESRRRDRKAGSIYITTAKGAVRSCVTNAMRWLPLHGPWIEFDTFRDRIVVGGDPLRDGHFVELTSAMEVMWDTVVAKTHVEDAVRTLARENAFSSLERYLTGLTWDGIGRIEHFFMDYYEAADTPYHREVGRILFVSAVARAMRPGCKVDTVPLLIGDQGIGKSDVILHLCPDPDWFTDEVGNIGADRAGENLRGKWLVEMPELSRVSQSTVETMKKFITCQKDRYKVPYEREPRDFLRTNIFVGSTNDETPLRDLENRRFLPVHIPPRDEQEKNKAVDAIKTARDQLWAEAMHRFLLGEKWWIISSYLITEAREQGETARAADAWEDLLAERIQLQDRTTVLEAANLLGIQPDRLGRSEQTRIGNALKKIGFKKEREKLPPRAWYYKRQSVLP